MALESMSIRSRLMLLAGGIALLVGGVSAIWNVRASQSVLRDELRKRGAFIAGNLAYNVQYGVLTEDKPLLKQFLEGAMTASSADAEAASDVVGGVIRSTNGEILVQAGHAIKDLPKELPKSQDALDAVMEDGEKVILFRAPVTSSSGSGSGMAGELSDSSDRRAVKSRNGSVEVAITKKLLDRELRARAASTALVSVLLVALGGLAGWFLVGRWLGPLKKMAEVSEAVAKGDLTRVVDVETSDEIGAMARALREMLQNLRQIVDQIQEASVQVASSAGQISANAKVIIRGAQGQSQAAEETSTSMEEMAASIQTVAGSSQSLASYVEETSSSINEMGASIEEVARSASNLASTVTEASATIEEMTVSIEQMARDLERLSATVSDTSGTVDEMANFVGSVSHNADALSDSASRASLTVEELAGAVAEVAKLASEADRMSRRASEEARTAARLCPARWRG